MTTCKHVRLFDFAALQDLTALPFAALVQVVIGSPLNGTVELAGPEPIRLDELVRQFLSAQGDTRKVTTDVHALYFGIELNDQSLTPGNNPRIGPTRFEDWLSRSIARA